MHGKSCQFRKPLRIACHVIGYAVVFLALVVGEAYLRSYQAKPIPVDIAPGLPVSVSACRNPDFLWAGEAWHIDVKSDRPLELEIDGRIRIRLPAGTTEIYSNHDISNTRDYGLHALDGTPSRISVKSTSVPSTH